MTPRELKAHKKAPKHLKEIPVFKPQKRNKLPKPFKSFGGSRIESTGMIDVSSDHVAFMYGGMDKSLLIARSTLIYFADLRTGVSVQYSSFIGIRVTKDSIARRHAEPTTITLIEYYPERPNWP